MKKIIKYLFVLNLLVGCVFFFYERYNSGSDIKKHVDLDKMNAVGVKYFDNYSFKDFIKREK